MAETRLELKNVLFYIVIFLICHFMTGGVQSARAHTDEPVNYEERDALRYGACLQLVEENPGKPFQLPATGISNVRGFRLPVIAKLWP